MRKSLVIVISSVVLILVMVNIFHDNVYYNLKLEKLKQEYAIKPLPSVDHTQFSELQREFGSPQEVTEACISCHNQRHIEVMNSSHWNWERVSYIEGRGLTAAGKRNVINNFCIGAQTNEQACAMCHIGFGMTQDHYDFNNARNVDCMVCHDNSDEYHKGSAMAGYPERSVNLSSVAQSVGSPKKNNCGVCHFMGGGGNNVKHGDLEMALLSASREVDVHMAANGLDMNCVDCHTAENHKIRGRLYSVSSDNTNRASCEQCHTNTPHFDNILNRHNAKVSCQACHIPVYAKVNATKMEWRWSDAGLLHEGDPIETVDEMGNQLYISEKGTFTWATNVKPDYVWFNGTADHYILGDTIISIPLEINPLNGSPHDGESKIIPVKIHRGDQIYDVNYNILIQPRLFAEEAGDSAFWKDYDWDKAAIAGMNRVGLPYSGEYDFIETVMYWPVNHMVSPKSETVGCAECHTRNDDGRLANLAGFYLPGRDYNKPLEYAGIFLILASLAGVMLHASIRVFMAIKNKTYENRVIDYNKKDQY